MNIQKRDKGRVARPHTATPGMLEFTFLFVVSLFLPSARCVELLYDGRAQPNFDSDVLDNSSGPYLTYVNCASDAAPAK